MSGKTHILISPGQGLLKPSGNPIDLVQPSNRLEFGAYGDEVTWLLRVVSVSGAPTAWSLGARFEYCIEHTGATKQYTAPVWVPYAAIDLAADCREGVGPFGAGQVPGAEGDYGVIATEASTLPVAVKRTMQCSTLRHRMAFSLSMTGGTNPGLSVELLAQVH